MANNLSNSTGSAKGNLRDRINLPAALPLNSDQNNNNSNIITTTNPNLNEARNPLASTSASPPSPTISLDYPRDLAVDAIDGKFVETTSQSAAKALAKYYQSQGGEEFVVQNRVDEKGRNVYRIRPRSSTVENSYHPLPLVSEEIASPLLPLFPSHSSPTSPNPTFTIQNPSPRKPSISSPNHAAREWVLRTSRSIPLLRNVAKRSSSMSLSTRTSFNPNDSLQLPPLSPETTSNSYLSSPSLPYSIKSFRSTQLLRKTGSTPTLSANSQRLRTKSSLAILNAQNSNSQGDVLGRLLGLNSDEDRDGRSKRAKRGRGMGGLSPVTFDNSRFSGESEVEVKGKEKAFDSAAGSDVKRNIRFDSTSPPSPILRTRSDSLPSSFLTVPLFQPTQLHRANTITSTPFGPGVKLPRRIGSEELSISTSSGPISKSMRETASSETIRATKDSSELGGSGGGGIHQKKRKRFQDPEIFDFFQNLDSAQVDSFGITTTRQHSRQFSSSSSIASSISDSSRAAAHHITVSSAPGDDPRFVIWGASSSSSSNDRSPQSPALPPIPSLPSIYNGQFSNRRGSTEGAFGSSPSSTNSPGSSSRRWSLRDSKRPQFGNTTSSPATSIRDSVSSVGGGGGGKKVNSRILMASTVERLIAELTSKIEVELLCGFFLTYRSFVRPRDLLRLLITRFDWAMSPSSTPEDEAGRRIVRVRTFVVIRYWLLNFFADDFVPDRKLRSTLTDWLNDSSRETRIKESPKDLRLIKGLKKLVRKLKELHVALGPSETAMAAKALASTVSLLKLPGLSSVAEGSEGITTQGNGMRDILDEDVDLELEGTTPRPSTTPLTVPLSSRLPLPLPSHSTRQNVSPSPNQAQRSSSLPNPHPHQNLSSSSNSQNVIQKSFKGTFGRFKKLLRSTSNPLSRTNSNQDIYNNNSTRQEAFDEDEEFEKNETGDLLWVKGGLAKYLAYYGIEVGEEDTSHVQEEPVQNIKTGENLFTFPLVQDPSSSSQTPTSIAGLGIECADNDSSSSITYPLSSLLPSPIPPPSPKSLQPAPFQLSRISGLTNRSRPLNLQSPFSHSYDNENIFFLPQRPQSGRIELDDVDLSDEDEDVVEVKRTLRRLPAADNLRLVAGTTMNASNSFRNLGGGGGGTFRLSVESISSYGSPRSPYFTLGEDRERGRGTKESMVSSDEDLSAGVQVVPNFVLEGIDHSDDDDEPGDVEAALRRLEGIVDDSKEKEKARKVEKQMEKSLRLQLAAAAAVTVVDEDSSIKTEAVNFKDQDIEVTDRSRRPSTMNPTFTFPIPSHTASLPNLLNLTTFNPPVATIIRVEISPATLIPPDRPNLSQQIGIGQPPRKKGIVKGIARKPSFSALFSVASRPLSTQTIITPPTHRSFILSYRTDVLAQQFCLIERDLLRGVGWQELVGGSWRDKAPEYDVLDWEVYLKQKRLDDLKARREGREIISNSVEGSRARWNLTVNWVCSEIVLTASIEDRAVLISKFIRLAFKCYCQSNFQTLTQIIHGLQSPDIERLSSTWKKVPSWEMRKFRNMKAFVSHRNNFKLLREVSDALISEYGPPGQRSPLDSSRASSTRATKQPQFTGCIPFLGLFLRDLALNGDLPTFLDPTNTSSPANVDENGSLISASNPNAFSHLSFLSNSIPLQPLVNVHKQRVLASLVQRVLAFQEFAENYPYSIPDTSIYFKCLKIRSLSPTLITECSIRLA